MKTSHSILILSLEAEELIRRLVPIFELDPLLQVSFASLKNPKKSEIDSFELIIMDYEYCLKNPEVSQLAFQHLDKLAIRTGVSDPMEMKKVLGETRARHLFPVLGMDALAETRNFIVASLKKEFCTTETFIDSPVIHRDKISIRTSEHLEQQIQDLLDRYDFTGIFGDFRFILTQILNETLTNALFNAPVDNEGRFFHREQNRRETVVAEDGKAPLLEIVDGQDKMILSVKDFYGTLSLAAIDSYLARGEISNKKGGAGIGMFLVIAQAHQMVINIDAGKMTEFIVVLNKFRRFINYQNLEKSFHVYQRGL